MENRTDFGVFRIDDSKRTPQGGLKLNANLTRTGVFIYHRADGSIARELRLPEEVFKPESLETLKGAPVVEGHPDMVRTDNWSTVAKGHVGDNVKESGRYVAATVRINDKETVSKVENGSLLELSCGYSCEIENTSGTYQGEHYDFIQRNILYNHVGLGPKYWGRAGTEVALKFDSAYSYPMTDTAQNTLPGLEDLSKTVEKTHKKVKAILTKDSSEMDKLTGERDALKARCDELEGKLAEITSPAALDARVNARLALAADAKKLSPELKIDGQSDLEIMTAAIKSRRPELNLDGKSADYVAGVFSSLLDMPVPSPTIEALRKTNADMDATLMPDNKGEKFKAKLIQNTVDAARKAMKERNINAWKKGAEDYSAEDYKKGGK